MINGGQVFISVKVKEEIEHGNDELVTWLRDSAPQSCFISLDTDIMTKFQELQNWAFSQPFTAQGGLSVAGGCRCLTKELDMIAC